MGKKSKRSRTKQSKTSLDDEDERKRVPPSLREKKEEEETLETLKFQDPFVDEFQEEIIQDNDNSNDMDDEETNDLVKIQTLNPYHAISSEREMEMDPAAYKMHVGLSGEWPALSFDFITPDIWGQGRRRFPLEFCALVGTQADQSRNNSLQLWRVRNVGRLLQHNDDDDDELEDEEEEDDDDDVDYEPTFHHASTKHTGSINRLRFHHNNNNTSNSLVATWSDVGVVNLYSLDIANACAPPPKSSPLVLDAPQHVYQYSPKKNAVEGFAMDFSNQTHQLATGDNDGNLVIHLDPTFENAKQLIYSSSSSYSVEDIQWSPSEATVLSAATSRGHVHIHDVRSGRGPMLEPMISSTDVNALAWSPVVTHLMATGCDDGVWSVWDLRTFSSNKANPLARFTCHTTPITSMEWHSTDESMLAVSDDVGTFIYDLSVEEEEEQQEQNYDKKTSGEELQQHELPPQLLFAHTGSPMTKEIHWHPQIPSCLMCTAYDGLQAFIPSNL